MAKVLIAYGTGEGQTAKVSDHIARVIREHGHEARVEDAKGLAEKFSPEGYDAVIVGASIHAGKHEAYVRDFVRKNREVLERVPSAFFSVSMTAREETEEARRHVEGYVEGFARKTRWQPEEIGVFAGAIPYTRYGFVKKRLIRFMAKRMEAGTDISRDFEYTDWEAVTHFAEGFLEGLGGGRSPEPVESYEHEGR